MNSMLKYSNIDVEKIKITQPNEMKAANGAPYRSCGITYDVGTAETPCYGDFAFQTPPVFLRGGIWKMPKKEGTKPKLDAQGNQEFDYSVNVILDTSKPEVVNLTNLFDGVYQTVANFVGENKLKFGPAYKKFDPASGQGFKNPVYKPIDKATGAELVGKNPSIFIKLDISKMGKTPFYSGKSMTLRNWDDLYEKGFEAILCVHVRRLYVGTTLSLQIYVNQALITKLVAVNDPRMFAIEEYAGELEDVDAQLDNKSSYPPTVTMTHSEEVDIMNQVPQAPIQEDF